MTIQRASFCAALLLAGLGWGSPGFAQSTSPIILPNGCGTGSAPQSLAYLTVDPTLKLCVNATVSASVTGFRPATTGTPIPVTTANSTGALPGGGEVVATNVGTTNGAYCALGATASTSSQYIAPNGGWFGFGISGDTQLTCVTSTGTTTINLAGGTGLPTGTGGGGSGGGGGGGGAVFGPTANGTAAANPPVLLGGTANGTGTGAVANLKVTAAGVASTDTSTVNGVTTLAGAGAVGAGAQRIAVGQDTTTVAGSAPGTAGTPSANVVSIQGVTSGTPVSTSLASGAVNSGAYAAGALAAGAFATGAGVDGWDLTQGAQANSVCSTATGTCSVVSLLKYLNSQAATIATNSALPAPVNINGSAVAQTGVQQGTTPSATVVAGNVVDTPGSASETDCSGSPTTTAASFLAASALHRKVTLKVEGAGAVCFNRTGGTATIGSAGTFCLKGASAANAGDGASYATPVGQTDTLGISAIAATATSLVYCSWQ